jgi:hypothetical protein
VEGDVEGRGSFGDDRLRSRRRLVIDDDDLPGVTSLVLTSQSVQRPPERLRPAIRRQEDGDLGYPVTKIDHGGLL